MTEQSVVITGLSLRLPGAPGVDDFWQLLRDGVDRTAPVSEKRRRLAHQPDWDDFIGEIADIDHFDADFFDIEEAEARLMDPQHRMIMEVAYDAVTEAGLAEPGQTSGQRYAVFMAMSTNAYYPMVCRWMEGRPAGEIHPRTIMNSFNGALAARVSHQFNLTGPVMAVDTACSSFLTALVQAADSIRDGRCDGAVVGGVNVLSSAYTNMLCNSGGITTAHHFTRVFDEKADGTLIGEGAVVCVLERVDIARAKNRRIYGRILGYAINNDGSSLNIMAPNPRGQANVIRDAYANGLDHRRVGYIETHGAGTRIGDPIELNALGHVYKKEDFGDDKVGIGSVKTNIGHLLSAAGGAGLAKLLLSLGHGELVPSLHLETVNPLLELEDTPFEVVVERRTWPRINGQPRVGAITSLGLGGTNVHVVVEEGETGALGPELTAAVLCLSAKSEEAVHRMIADTAEHLGDERITHYNLAMTCARFRPAHPWRAVMRFMPETGVVTNVSVRHVGRSARRVLLRPDAHAEARQEFLAGMVAGRVLVSDEKPRASDLVVTFDPDSDDPRALVLNSTQDDLEIAAELFSHGCPVAWHHFFPDGVGTIATLAPYPFHRRPIWLHQ